MFNRIPGTKDVLPEEIFRWQEIECIGRRIFALYNFSEIRPPLVEQAELFTRSLGEFAEVVQKQMFLVKNQDDLYALRPEATASVARAYIENSLDRQSGFLKLYYLGPMFRLERPQKGRLRQFHHIGCEAIGSGLPETDIEVISLADALLKAWQVKGSILKLNSLGCSQDKNKLSQQLKNALKEKIEGLCQECKARYEHNTLRILDCKKEPCQKLVHSLKLDDGHLCPECQAHFLAVKDGLSELGIAYRVSPELVRGLDYYTRTIFEFTHEALGAQDAIGAGGRYDNLIKELGGPNTGATGFAFGVERIILAQGSRLRAQDKDLIYVIRLGEEAKKEALKILAALRQAEIPADTDYQGKSLKGALRRANDLGAKAVLLLGENELKKGIVTFKNMESGEQKEIKQDELVTTLKSAFSV